MTTKKPGADRQVRYGRILGLVFAAAGFVVIGLGWNGMAKVACPDCQLPYLLSGGATGLGLIVVGSALILVAGHRAERLEQDARLEEVVRTIGRLGTAVAATGESANGLVVAGKSTYHRPECRLVRDKELDRVTVEAAVATGLSACRVCSPATVDEAKREAPAGEKEKARAEKPRGRKSSSGKKK